jgi:hypothetical protein
MRSVLKQAFFAIAVIVVTSGLSQAQSIDTPTLGDAAVVRPCSNLRAHRSCLLYSRVISLV